MSWTVSLLKVFFLNLIVIFFFVVQALIFIKFYLQSNLKMSKSIIGKDNESLSPQSKGKRFLPEGTAEHESKQQSKGKLSLILSMQPFQSKDKTNYRKALNYIKLMKKRLPQTRPFYVRMMQVQLSFFGFSFLNKYLT